MLFSILIPAYKARYLSEAISSVLAQTCSDWELVIVNDASPENLTSIVEQFSDPRIRYYVNEHNCGAIDVVDNWNICLSHALGDYVICMGDDDRLLPCCLEEYTRLISQYPGLDVYHGWTMLIDEQGEPFDMQEPRPLTEDVYSLIWHRWHGRKQYIGDFLLRTDPLKAAGGYYKIPLAWGSDDISAFRAAAAGIANTQVPVFQYRVNRQTISRTSSALIKLAAIDAQEQWYLSFLATPPSATATEPARILHAQCLHNLPWQMTKRRTYTIAAAIQQSPLRWLPYFLLHARQFHVKPSHVCFALIQAMKERQRIS